jgi:riboflavin transporter FmnP
MARGRSFGLVAVALLAALSGALQLSHQVLGFPTGFGMQVDLVGVPALLAFFLFGFEASAWVLVLSSAVIAVASPELWIGASMKFAGTLPMIAVPGLYAIYGRNKKAFAALSVLLALFTVAAFAAAGAAGKLVEQALAPLPFGNVALGLSAIALLAVFALALSAFSRRGLGGEREKAPDFGAPAVAAGVLAASLVVRAAVTLVSNYYFAGPVFFGLSPEAFMSFAPWYVIAGWNCVQGAIEFGVAWALAYRFGLMKAYSG